MRASSSRSLPFPAAPHLRTALLADLDCFDAVATYPQIRWRQVSLFAPEVLAGRTEDLQKFADGVFRSEWELPSLNTAVFNLTALGQGPMTPAERQKLWRAFHVPVYQLLFDPDTGVLASECEAHEGWHVRHTRLRFDMQSGTIVFRKNGFASSPINTGLTAMGLDGVCACGDEAPLLRGVKAAASKPVRVKVVGA